MVDTQSSSFVGCAIAAVALTAGAIILLKGCDDDKRRRDNFTRANLTMAPHCMFSRTPVDYAYEGYSSIPSNKGMLNPHWLGDKGDKAQPLEDGFVDLLRDEKKLQNPDLLWRQYEPDYMGCGNGEPYIVDDNKTVAELTDTGSVWLVRKMRAEYGPNVDPYSGRHRALTEEDAVTPDPFDKEYGGLASGYLPFTIGD